MLIYLTRGFIAESKISLGLYFFAHLLSIYASYFLYVHYIAKGPDYLLPSIEDFRTELWLIIILFLYKVFNEINLTEGVNMKGFQRSCIARYNRLSRQYSKYLDELIKQHKQLELLFFSVAIYEDLNRNWLHRKLERLFFPFLKNKTTGIMQVYGERPRTDKESIEIAQKILLQNFKEMTKNSMDDNIVSLRRDSVKRLLRGYNTRGYSDKVYEIFGCLMSGLPLPSEKGDRIKWLVERAEYYFENFDHDAAYQDLLKALRLDPINDEAFESYLTAHFLYGYDNEEKIERLLLLKRFFEDKTSTVDEEQLKMFIEKIGAIDQQIVEIDMDDGKANRRSFPHA